MIYCIEDEYFILLRKKPFDSNTVFNSDQSRMIVKYLGEFDSYHLYLDLASGYYLWTASELENYDVFEIAWRLE